MSDPLLNVMKIMLLAGLYLFFIRVLWSVYNELRDPRTRVTRRPQAATAPLADSDIGQAQVAKTPAHTLVASRGQARATGGPAGRAAARASVPAAAAPVRAVVDKLVVIEPPELAGTIYPLSDNLVIGRSSDCGVWLDDTYVSHHHARVFTQGSGVYIEDLGSRNGSLLNETLLGEPTPVTHGDRLTLGASVMEFS